MILILFLEYNISSESLQINTSLLLRHGYCRAHLDMLCSDNRNLVVETKVSSTALWRAYFLLFNKQWKQLFRHPDIGKGFRPSQYANSPSPNRANSSTA